MHEVSYNLTLDDLLAFQLDHIRYQKSKHSRTAFLRNYKVWLWTILGILVAVLLVFGTGHGRQAEVSRRSTSQIQLAHILIGAFFLIFLYRWLFRKSIIRQNLEKQQKAGTFDKVLGECRLSIAPDGFTFWARDTTTSVRWPGVHDIVVGKELAYFYTSPNVAYLLPRRAFADGAAFEAFVESARAYRNDALTPPKPSTDIQTKRPL
jgi:hypothetical protein